MLRSCSAATSPWTSPTTGCRRCTSRSGVTASVTISTISTFYNIYNTTGKFHYLDNYMAVYYKLLNERGGMHPVNNPIQPGDFHSFPPGFRWTVHGEQESRSW